MPTFLILGSKLQAKAQALGLYSISEQFEHFLVFVLFSTKKYHFDWNVIKFSKCIVFMSPYVHLYSFIITLIAFELIVCFFQNFLFTHKRMYFGTTIGQKASSRNILTFYQYFIQPITFKSIKDVGTTYFEKKIPDRNQKLQSKFSP